MRQAYQSHNTIEIWNTWLNSVIMNTEFGYVSNLL